MSETQASQENPPCRQVCVCDTHIVLEAFWFGDPRVRGLLGQLRAGCLAWYASSAMRAELASVLQRLPVRAEAPPREHVLTSFDRWATLREGGPVPVRLWCTDPQDQIFVDLALASGARWLFTRDRALLRLARRAAPLGCAIVPPECHAPAALPEPRGRSPRPR